VKGYFMLVRVVGADSYVVATLLVCVSGGQVC
jgi:hypothetical protein